MDYNKGYVDKIYDILESDKVEKDKKTADFSPGDEHQ